MIRRDYSDIDYVVVADLHENKLSMNFKVYNIVGRYVSDNSLIFPTKDDGTTEDLENSEVHLSGFIKWDGCSNLHFDEQDNVMLHFCSKEDIRQLGILLVRLYEIAAELMPNHAEYLTYSEEKEKENESQTNSQSNARRKSSLSRL